jgi:hypothetical protein
LTVLRLSATGIADEPSGLALGIVTAVPAMEFAMVPHHNSALRSEPINIFSRRSLLVGAPAFAAAAILTPRFAKAQVAALFDVIVEAGTAFYLEKLFEVLVKPVSDAENAPLDIDPRKLAQTARKQRHKAIARERFALSNYSLAYSTNEADDFGALSYTGVTDVDSGETAVDAINAHFLHKTAHNFSKAYPSIDEYARVDILYPLTDDTPSVGWKDHTRRYVTARGKLRIIIQPEIAMCRATAIANNKRFDFEFSFEDT